ncbi:MAG: ABC transporter permease [Gemmatimonadota bacterium]|nr:ABC transporter permease [Gemmatimonadota bacterium]
MRALGALFRASWLSAASYRLRMLVTLASLILAVVPIFFVARALQPLMAKSIAQQGGDFFPFVLVGIVAFTVVSASLTSLPDAITNGIQTGTLEALLGTPQRLPVLLGGLISYDIVWSAIRATLLFVIGLALGARVNWEHALLSIGILILIALGYLGFGVLAAALTIAFRTSGPLVQGVLTASALLGGVYYPTSVIPSWVQGLSVVIPLTYGLRALRRSLLQRVSLSAIAPDVLTLLCFVVALLAIGSFAMARALRYARRAGTLAQY